MTSTNGRAAYEAWWAADAKYAHLAAWTRELATTREQWEAAARAVETAEVKRLREASAVTAVNFGKAQLEIAQLQTKLARVEALPAKWSRDEVNTHWNCVHSKVARELREALSDSQPSAAPTPKGEPYNGY